MLGRLRYTPGLTPSEINHNNGQQRVPFPHVSMSRGHKARTYRPTLNTYLFSPFCHILGPLDFCSAWVVPFAVPSTSHALAFDLMNLHIDHIVLTLNMFELVYNYAP